MLTFQIPLGKYEFIIVLSICAFAVSMGNGKINRNSHRFKIKVTELRVIDDDVNYGDYSFNYQEYNDGNSDSNDNDSDDHDNCNSMDNKQ